ncbi:MAG: desulfoferrodoxin FeS4 iron-binding domain-containing protein [Candidatus Methanomethylophilaceae archaeon]|nr:desulfoferrodoxin FeS4 iron-binding domain-containing protein [Thermoplasmata archaeon]MBQ2763056.1 desulfoferrodoxin FeS4 iron-binding domain-containing protein [Candidatus Methanomethylophilaceae archaeon]
MADIYRCTKCGKIVEVEFEGPGKLSCCGEEMILQKPKTADYSTEKHVPYVEKVDGGVLVKVGKETAHPMDDAHYIVYIQIEADGVIMRKYLKPGDKPEAFFKTDASVIKAEELCNIHGVWVSE